MASSSVNISSLRIGDFVLRFRAIIGGILLLISAILGYYCTKVNVATKFDDFFPINHPNVKLYHQWQKYGGAQTLSVMVQVKEGEIFSYSVLKKIQDIQYDVDKLPGVDHNEVLSLASYRVSYAEATPGSLNIKPIMFPNVPKTPEDIAALKKIVLANLANISQYVSPDMKSAVVKASFNEYGLDYKTLFYKVQDIVNKYQDPNVDILVAGEPIVRGYGYYYEPTVGVLFMIAVAVMILILWLTGGQRSRWWAPIVTGFLSAVWGLGFVGVMIARRWGGGLSHLLKAGVAMLVVGVGVMTLITVASGLGWGWLNTLTGGTKIYTWLSPVTLIALGGVGLGILFQVGNHVDNTIAVARAIGWVGFAAAGVALLWQAYRGRLSAMAGLGLFLFWFVVLGPVVQPWYPLWAIIPLATCKASKRFRLVVTVFSALIALVTPPTGSTFDGRAFLIPTAAAAALITVGLLLLLVRGKLPEREPRGELTVTPATSEPAPSGQLG